MRTTSYSITDPRPCKECSPDKNLHPNAFHKHGGRVRNTCKQCRAKQFRAKYHENKKLEINQRWQNLYAGESA